MLLAILVPFLSFFFRGEIIFAIICLVLQITLISWAPAVFWAVMSLNNARANRRNDKLFRAIKQTRRY